MNFQKSILLTNTDQLAKEWTDVREKVLWQKIKAPQGSVDGSVLIKKYRKGKDEDEKNDKKKRTITKTKVQCVGDLQREKVLVPETVDWSEMEFCRYLRTNTGHKYASLN